MACTEASSVKAGGPHVLRVLSQVFKANDAALQELERVENLMQ